MKHLLTEIVPVVVTYNPAEPTLTANLTALLSQVQYVVIVDNDSTCDVADIIGHLDKKQHDRINLIKLQHNDGLSSAFNIGIASAHKLNAAFVLLMDQDSIPESDMVKKLHDAYFHLENQGISVAAVGPRYRNPVSGQLSHFVRANRFRLTQVLCHEDRTDYPRADFLISSGMLIAIRTLDKVGDMDAKLFIDHIDTEWCYRAQSSGFSLYGVCNAFMQHTLGDKQIRIWWGRWRNIPFHQPFRYYYIFRNSSLLWQRTYMPVAWKQADMLRILYILLFFTLFSSNRIANLRMMIKGLWDGLNNRSGKL
ncbi:glycosyltransferase family 2 protein [Nitrosomonas mobilis]|uniref:Rhamnosyltransferase n=1 Tax=Nitrosomonas mobilis TaxID=51642 RepID=A0A1G5SEC9_9PROT|nr:glycosyltransferase family 2 protein [Nitrosomonas mobilis]SCZ85553.1 Rhamnosyltransferase [Nitrosomonas mobilis]